MANLVVQHQPGDEFYRVLDVDANLIVGSFVDPQVANSFAAAGNTSKEALFAAVQSDVNATGGTQSSANSPPGTSPATPYVQPSYIKTGSDSTYQQPTYVTPPSGNNVTYASTDDPESRAIFAQLKAQAAAARPQYTTQTVANPLYEGGTQTVLVPTSQTKSSATEVTNTPTATGSTYTITTPPVFTTADKPVPNYLGLYNEATGTYQVLDPNTGAIIADNLPDQATANEVAGLQASLGSSTPVPISQIDNSAANVANYVALYNEATATWQVLDSNTGAIIADNLPDEATANEVLGLQQAAVSSTPVPQPKAAAPNPYANGTPYDDEGNLNPGWTLDENNNPVFVGGDFVEPATLASAQASRTSAATERARKQQVYIDQQRNLNNADWRVRLTLAPNSSYLYNVADPGILDPLKPTNGVIFPYTPQIATSYKANYSHYDLTHSNYRGYFYQNSYTDNVVVTGTFTAQTTQEANYLLAVIHFFRSVTKMFYGQSPNVGSPPPVCYLNGLGEYQFNKHPVLVTNFNYTLPRDVDYIRAGSANNLQLNQNPLRAKTNTVNPQLASVQRLANAFLRPGANRNTPPPPTQPNKNNPTYVPTKIEIVVTLMPIQSRTQVSQQFNLQTFANGQLLRGGFW